MTQTCYFPMLNKSFIKERTRSDCKSFWRNYWSWNIPYPEVLNGFKLSRPSSHCNSMKEYKIFYVWSEQCITLPSPFSVLVMVLPNYTRRPSYKRIKGWLIGATAKLMMFNFTSKCWHGFQFNNTIFITFL